MTILSDKQIASLCKPRRFGPPPMLDPYVGTKHLFGLTYGPSSFGYDIRLGKIFIKYHPNGTIIDPKDISTAEYLEYESVVPFAMAPGDFILAHSLETFNMPPDVTGIVHDKSTYARCGISVQNTVIEAGWSGVFTLEITNHNCCPVQLYPGEGIAQIIFYRGETPRTEYFGKYQNQTGVTLPR